MSYTYTNRLNPWSAQNPLPWFERRPIPASPAGQSGSVILVLVDSISSHFCLQTLLVHMEHQTRRLNINTLSEEQRVRLNMVHSRYVTIH